MPFQSEKQRRYLWANEPEIARDWADTYGSRIEKNDGGIMRVGLRRGSGGPAGGATIGSGSAQSGSPASSSRGGYEDSRTAGKSYEAAKARSHPKASGQGSGYYADKWQQDALKQFANLSSTTSEPTISSQKKAKKASVLRKAEKKSIANFVRRNKYKNLKLAGMYGKPRFKGFLSEILGGINPPDEVDYFDEDSIREIASTYGGDLSKLQTTGLEGLRKDLAFTGDTTKDMRKYYGLDKPMTPGGDGGGYRGYRNYEEWLAAQGRDTGVTEVAEVIEEEPISDFQKSIAGGPQLQYEDYGTAAHGRRHNVDERMFSADGGRIPAAYGGIMDSSTGRRAYGLGSIFKSIKKAAGKVLKSDVGKAALMAAATYKLGGGNFFGGGDFKFGNILPNLLYKDPSKAFSMKNLSAWKGIGALSMLPFLTPGPEEDEDEAFDYDAAKQLYADKIMNIKAGAMAGTLDPNKFSYLGVKDGGRIGLYAGGQSIPSEYTMEDARKTSMQDKMGGITEIMKVADLYRKGDVGQFYAAHGGSADDKLMARVKELQDEGLDYNSAMAQAIKELSQGKAQGGRIGYANGTESGYTFEDFKKEKQQVDQFMGEEQLKKLYEKMMREKKIAEEKTWAAQGGRIGADEGGLMDLGGMEKDYRNDGGFVPLGGEEKADDVPARLSKNEFVFTADAVRGAGDGDIDKGAEVMENVMKNLEQGGQVSEETQGLSGAQEMFGVSERLSEVV